MKVLALPIAEEASDAPCDTGSDIEILRKEFPEKVDFEYVKSGWYLHEGEYATDPKALNARAAKLRRFIRGRPEKEIVLVTHGFFAHFLTGDVDEEGKQTTPWWGETELRTFRFVDDEEAAMIEEVEESGARREGKGHELIVNDPRLR
ncbi:Phosphoglycerate mutase family [Teratosphaeria destructans]|uniref:Phosphoglycerate mutase family n=1 Tax=Teratosphaeria destructans TaxID=418781 RepID=A0A9W7SHJ1_9PEZI|nr:Phosphoglycerate mutase family [Teratosphaeria destructans]